MLHSVSECPILTPMNNVTEIHVNPYHLAQTVAALRIEVKTGLRHSRGSVWKMAKEAYGVTGNKATVLAKLEELNEKVKASL